MNKNKKNALFNQVYGMYLEVKMQEITINLKGRYVTLDFEIEKILLDCIFVNQYLNQRNIANKNINKAIYIKSLFVPKYKCSFNLLINSLG